MGIGRSSGNLRAPDKFRRFSGVGASFHISSRHQDFVNRNPGRGVHGNVAEQRAAVKPGNALGFFFSGKAKLDALNLQ
jgi:hypothetical protein